jgi:hypothetical protein
MQNFKTLRQPLLAVGDLLLSHLVVNEVICVCFTNLCLCLKSYVVKNGDRLYEKMNL